MSALPDDLSEKGFVLYAEGIARRPRPNPHTGHAGHKWEWLALMFGQRWVKASSERHAREILTLGDRRAS